MQPTSAPHEVLLGPQRDQLEAFLDEARADLARSLDGLTDEQARRQLVPSLTTLLSLVKHAAFAERVWFAVALGGMTRAELDLPDTVDQSFTLTVEDSIVTVLADFEAAVATSRDIAARYDLDDIAEHNRRGPLTVRWMYLHMATELAQHAGHADILREQILATHGTTEQ